MRILLVEFTSAVSGAERSMLELVQGLTDTHELALACPDGPLADLAAGLGVEVFRIPESQLTFRLDPRHTPRALRDMAGAAWRLRAIVRRWRPAVVHANSIRAGLLAIPAGRRRAAIVVHCRDALPGGPAGGAVRTAILGGSDHVVAISKHVATNFGGAGWEQRPISVIHNAVDVVRFDPAVVGRAASRAALGVGDDLVLSVIAQITPWKGQDLAIRTLGELRRRGRAAVLLVVGEAKFVGASTRHDNRAFERGLHALVAELGLGSHVRFLGERSDPERILAASDVLLVPSVEEPFGRTVIESMAMGVPVVATSRGGPPEILRDTVGGVTAEGRDPTAWADAVEHTSHTSTDRRGAARGSARTRFSRERHTTEMLAVYHAAVARRGFPPAAGRVRLGTPMDAPAPTEDEDLSYLRDRWDREQVFHDDLAGQLDPAALPPTGLAHFDAAVLARAGVGPGTRVLDLGCGQGDLTLALMARGALVTGLDLSGGMLEVARRRAELYLPDRSATFVAAPVERTGLPAGSFDVIVGRWILHHVDLRPAARELARILAPGGRAVFLENSGANPLLNFARDHIAGRYGIPRFGTADERPLVAEDWSVLERSFARVTGEFPIVDIFELFNRQVFRYRSRRAGAVCRAIDRLIGRSALRRYSYRVLVIAEK